MVPIGDELAKGSQQTADYFFNEVTYKDMGVDNPKNLSFNQPLFEFSGACAGCGETPYIKALNTTIWRSFSDCKCNWMFIYL
jgi:pyruvate-ferredoxin/flavodoxin oxidoreductase